MNHNPTVKINLPLEAEMVMRKCENGALILAKNGKVYEMKYGKSYQILKDFTLQEKDSGLSAGRGKT